jgi:hypothetical protein
MNEAALNVFDAGNAAMLCAASAAAYSDYGTYEAVVARSTDTHVRIVRAGADVIVAFRGTADVRNWLTDLDCAWELEARRQNIDEMHRTRCCRIHRGFARAVDSVEAEISAEIFASSREGRRLWLTGHSLGGALGMLFAWRFFNAHQFAPFAGIYTFGQPRVGNAVFRDCYNSNRALFGGTFRVIHADDVVPRIPWLLGAYRHAGHEVFFTEKQKVESGKQKCPMMDPSVAAKLPWDIRGAWRELRRGKLALLADHHVNTYLGLFRGLTGTGDGFITKEAKETEMREEEVSVDGAPHSGHSDEFPSKMGPPHPNPLLHECVEERGMERCARIQEKARLYARRDRALPGTGDGFTTKDAKDTEMREGEVSVDGASGHSDEFPSKMGPPHPDSLLHECVEERGMERCARIQEKEKLHARRDRV